MNVCRAKKKLQKNSLPEEQIMIQDAEVQNDSKVANNSTVFIYKKIYSIIFFYFFKSTESIRKNQSIVDQRDILSFAEMNDLKRKVDNTALFMDIYSRVVSNMKASEIFQLKNDKFLVNLGFFEGFQTRFCNALKERKESEISYMQLYNMFNEMIPKNPGHAILRENANEFINRLVHHKKIEITDSRHDSFKIMK